RQPTPASAQATTQLVPVEPAVIQFGRLLFAANVNSGSTTITLTRSGNLEATVAIVLASPGGHGVPAFQTTVVFGPNVTSRSVPIAIVNDRLPGRSDVVIPLGLSSPGAGASLGAVASASLVIHDNNPPLVRVKSLRVATVQVGTRKKPKRTTGLVVQLTGAVNRGGAQALAAYQLVMAGRDKRFGTRDDKRVALASARYDAVAHTATLIPKTAFNTTQLQQLRVKSALLTDSLGRPIDGNHDGQPGGDFVATLKGKSITIASTMSLRRPIPINHR